VLGLGAVDEDELYAALDWLVERQPAVEAAMARRHLTGGALVLYDVSSSYVEGRCCELARRGHNRDGKKGKLQIVYGLLCAAAGCPVAVEVFEGNTADPTTLSAQISKLKERFDLDHVVLVGDRGMITQARIDADLAPAGLERRCAPPPCRAWWRAAPCNSPCSTSATWRRSPPRRIPANG
jgi:transposase